MLANMPSSLGIAVIHHRTPQVALDCLARLRTAAPGAQVVVVDTAPDPSFRRELAELHPDVAFLPVANHSYARSVNSGLAALDATWLVQMNADVFVEPHTFDHLLGVLRHHPTGAVAAPLALDPTGAPQAMGAPYARHYRRLDRAARLNRLQGEGPTGALPAYVTVSWVAGYLQAMSRDTWHQVGGFDESFRFFNEDLDFCLRARQAGFHCLLVDSPVLHLGGSSTPTDPAFHAEGRRGGWLLARRHHGRARRLAHHAFLWAEAVAGSWLHPSRPQRAGHRLVLEMLRSGAWDESPFGPTLDDRSGGG